MACRSIRFWEDTWFGNSPLSVQFWDLYVICNQMGSRLADIWDGQEVKLTFRRTFDDEMLETWFELEGIVKSVVYKPGGDALVWVYNSNGVYSTNSLYAIINFRGVQPVLCPCCLESHCSPKDSCVPLAFIQQQIDDS